MMTWCWLLRLPAGGGSGPYKNFDDVVARNNQYRASEEAYHAEADRPASANARAGMGR